MTKFPASPAITPSTPTGSIRSPSTERRASMHLTQNWEIRKPRSIVARRYRRVAKRDRGPGRRRDAAGGRQRGRRRRRHRLCARCGRAVEQRPRRDRVHGRAPGRRRSCRDRRFRPGRAARPRPGRVPVDRGDEDRAVHLAAGRRRPQHARTALLRDPERGARLCSGGRALRATAVARPGHAGDRACPRRPAGRLVHDGEGRQCCGRSASL